MADLGIDGRGSATGGVEPSYRGSGGCAPSGGTWGRAPVGGQGAKQSRALFGKRDARQKRRCDIAQRILQKCLVERSGDVNVKYIVDNPLLIFARFFVFTACLLQFPFCSVSLTGPTHVSKIIDYFPLKQQQTSGRTQER